MSLREVLRPDSTNLVVVSLRLGTGVLASGSGVWLLILGNQPGRHWILLIGSVLLAGGLMALSSGFVGLRGRVIR